MGSPADDGESLIREYGPICAEEYAKQNWREWIGKRDTPEHDQMAESACMAVWMYVRGYIAGSEEGYAEGYDTGLSIGRETGWDDCLAAYTPESA